MKSGLIIAIALLCGIAQAGETKCLDYEPAVVKLRGTLVSKVFPGPPEYKSIRRGDEPEEYWLLKLSHPVCVNKFESEPDAYPEQHGIREMQLVFMGEKLYKKYHPLLGRRIVASGTLYAGFNAHHKTKVLLTVDSLVKRR